MSKFTRENYKATLCFWYYGVVMFTIVQWIFADDIQLFQWESMRLEILHTISSFIYKFIMQKHSVDQ